MSGKGRDALNEVLDSLKLLEMYQDSMANEGRAYSIFVQNKALAGMVRPIPALQSGAEQSGSGRLIVIGGWSREDGERLKAAGLFVHTSSETAVVSSDEQNLRGKLSQIFHRGDGGKNGRDGPG